MLLIAALAAFTSLDAAVVNIDFQGGGGVTTTTESGAVLQSSGGIWNVNGEGYGVEVPLVTSHGLPHETTLWTDGFTGVLGEGDALYSDYLSGDVELRGLEPGHRYELVLYSAANIATLFRFDGPWSPTGASAAPPDSGVSGDAVLPGVEGCNYFRGMAEANALGVIALHANLGAIAGLQLDLPGVQNPEPTVLFLQGIAVLLGLARRRRSS